ncbi:MAG: FAD-dependent oxidoreductase [Sedimentisphaerales bacterium]|nr:FAD-dependent oxidoreductase [Sedimentisphaerales bacterium]
MMTTSNSDKSKLVPHQTLLYRRDVPLQGSFNVVVCGGGPAGIAGALAARREGLRVLLVEGQGQLGGVATSGLVAQWLGGRTDDTKTWVVGGIFRRLAQEAARAGCAIIPQTNHREVYQVHGWHKGQNEAGVVLDPFELAHFLDGQMAAAGVEILLHTQAVDVNLTGNHIKQVILFNKSGFFAVNVLAVIDATGDGDIAARSGCKMVKGRPSDGLMTPATLEFHVDNVDQDILSDYIHAHKTPRFQELVKKLRQGGDWPFDYEIFISVQLLEKGVMMINTSRLTGIDGTDGKSVTDGMIRGRSETQQLLEIMRRHFPGFAHARLKAVAPLLGVRETRRIVAEVMLTVDDLRGGKTFTDTIGYSAYGWDLPDPIKPSYQPMWETNAAPVHKVKKKQVTPIPYRIMVPQPIGNLICPGRAVSVERDALGPVRVMAPCMAMGEAAGEAAVQVVRRNIDFRDVDIPQLREQLRRHEAIVDWKDNDVI